MVGRFAFLAVASVVFEMLRLYLVKHRFGNRVHNVDRCIAAVLTLVLTARLAQMATVSVAWLAYFICAGVFAYRGVLMLLMYVLNRRG